MNIDLTPPLRFSYFPKILLLNILSLFHYNTFRILFNPAPALYMAVSVIEGRKSPTFKTGNSVSKVGLGCLFDFDLLNVAHAALAVVVGKDNQSQLVVLQAVVISENGAFSASIRAALIMSCCGTPVSSSTFCGVNCIT